MHPVKHYPSNEYILYDSMYMKLKKRQNEISSSQKFVLEVERLTQKQNKTTFGDDRNIVYLDCGGDHNNVVTHVKYHYSVHFK